jgi:histidinol dehydrogenase
MLRILSATDTAAATLADRRVTRDPLLQRRVAAIVATVRRGGDRALARYAAKFDGLDGPIEVDPREIRNAAGSVPRDVRAALAACARNIRRVAVAQRPRPSRVRVAEGVTVEHRVVPLGRVGCYVPAGRYPLPSSLLMTAIPARVAGVAEVVAACPRPDAVVMAAAREAGVTRLFRVGGAHAIAALAYGTATVPRVDKIVGPGSRYVAAAKALVSQDCPIDFEAGPSELVWLADRGRPDWIARDLVAQAEHDPDARPLLVTTSRTLAEAVRDAVAAAAPVSGPAAEALARNGAAIVAATRAEALALVDRIAPEHLAVDDRRWLDPLPRAGTVFVGAYAAPAAGDYATGSNHVLPTAGGARFRGGLTAADFVRVVSVQRLTEAGIRRVGKAAIGMARVEGLTGHAASLEARLA